MRDSEGDRLAVILIRFASGAYWMLLTILLLSPDPRAVLGLGRVRHLPSDEVAHLTCFTLLALLAHACRLPVRRTTLLAALAVYGIAAEATQHFVPNRKVELIDFTLNLSGMALGTCVWLAAAWLWRTATRRIAGVNDTASEAQSMSETAHFRILTAEGDLSHDTFTIAAEQPLTVKADCVVAVNDRDGSLLTVHGTRLVPVGPASSAPHPTRAKSVCLECGRVEGVIEDQVACPRQDDTPCGMLETHAAERRR
jgi:hypothetical protein